MVNSGIGIIFLDPLSEFLGGLLPVMDLTGLVVDIGSHHRGFPVTAMTPSPTPSESGLISGTRMRNREVRSTRVSRALFPLLPMARSPSQCPNRSAFDVGGAFAEVAGLAESRRGDGLGPDRRAGRCVTGSA
jgi:hypothetical protein